MRYSHGPSAAGKQVGEQELKLGHEQHLNGRGVHRV
jgi:hypothetical protein